MHMSNSPRHEELRSVLKQREASGALVPNLNGVQLQIFLCGVCVAVALVSPAFAASSRRMRVFLTSVIALNIIYTACRAMFMIDTSSAQARDAAFFYATETPEQLLAAYSAVALEASVQIFYAIRVAKILQAKLLRLLWLAIFAAGLCASLVGWAGLMSVHTAKYLGFRNGLGAIIDTYGGSVHFFASAFVDILISTTLALFLRRNMLGFNVRTDTVLQRIARVTLATGALTSVAASVAAILELTSFTVFKISMPTTFSWTLASLHCLSLFWTLDLRSRLRREQGGRHVEISLGLPLSLQSPSTAGSGRSRGRLECLEMPYLGNPLHVHTDFAQSPATIEEGCDTLT